MAVDLRDINVKQVLGFSAKKLMNESIVALAILQMFFSATIPSLKVLQIPVELILFIFLFVACTTVKFNRWQILLLYVSTVITIASFATTELSVSVVNAKQIGLAVLILLYFSKIKFNSKLILPTVTVSIILLIINKFFPGNLESFISLSFNKEFNMSRFGGIFLNAHFNAVFIAIALIYYGQCRRLYGFGVWILYITASKFIFVSYIAHLLYTNLLARYLSKHSGIFILLIILGVFTFVSYADVLINYLIDNNGVEKKHNSAIIILYQLIDPAYYKFLLSPLPSVYSGAPEGAKVLFAGHDGTNEIGLFAFFTQSGFFIALLYLFVLFKHARLYIVFIMVTLLHNNFILSPLCIVMFVTYSKEILLHRTFKPKPEKNRVSRLGYSIVSNNNKKYKC